MGFLRLMADLALPNGDEEEEGVCLDEESVAGDTREMGLGGAARRVEASGGVCSDMFVGGELGDGVGTPSDEGAYESPTPVFMIVQ